MKPITPDPQLAYELQELHMLSKHWTSDVNFIQDEIRILQDVIKIYLTHTENLQLEEAMKFDKILVHQNEVSWTFKNKIIEFLNFIEPFVNESKNEIGINLIENFVTLEHDITSQSEYIKLLRKLIFSFAEDVMRAERGL